MDFTKILAELVAERDKIEEAIAAIRSLDRKPITGVAGGPRRRGRPPGSRNGDGSYAESNADVPSGDGIAP